MAYLLLTKHQTHRGIQANWEVFVDLEEAKLRQQHLVEQSEAVREASNWSPLVESVLVVVEPM